MKKFEVTGMGCAACQARVESAVSNIPDVESVSVNLLTNSMQVEGTATDEEIIKAVETAGYGAKIVKKNISLRDESYVPGDKETQNLKKRLITSVVLLIPLMYLSMGHMMWNFPVPDILKGNNIVIGIVQMVLSAIILIINRKFFVNGIKGVIHKAPNMDTLVAMGSGVAYFYSIYMLISMIVARTSGDNAIVSKLLHDLYFESAAMIVTLITVGKLLESYAKGKTTNAIKGLMDLAPKTATILKKDENQKDTEIIVRVDEVAVNDIFIVRPGESIPVDGIVIEGCSAVDESALTGESIPVDKSEGSIISSATMNLSGYMKCRATRVGEDTTLSQIIKMVSDASASKAPIAKTADKVSGIFVPAVIVIALMTMIIWLIFGANAGFALARGISVLVISCPCALGLATPVAIMVGNGVGAKHGILFKNATSIENTGKIKFVAFDKTGTITVGTPKVTDIYSDDEEMLLQIAYGIECMSEHPLAKAIVSYARKENVEPAIISDFKTDTGNGLQGRYNQKAVYAGNLKYITRFLDAKADETNHARHYAKAGKTPIFFAYDDRLLGIIAVSDVIKEDSPEAIDELNALGIKAVMLTGDNENTAKAIGMQAGISEVIAEVLPQEKEQRIEELMKHGMTAMVGDGINDAPALTKADIGIAIGGGTDIAMDAADVVLVKNNLLDVSVAIKLSRAVLKNIHENLFWAFIYNIIGIPIAAGVFYPLFGLKLNPMIGAAAMSLSSFCVVMNALRLNFVKVFHKSETKK